MPDPTMRPPSTWRMRRRDFLGVGAAFVGAAAAGPLLAQQPPAPTERFKGPPVWLDMDQSELDAAYDQSKYAPNLPQITKRYATNSEAVRSRLGAPRQFAYGPTAIESLDVYATKRPNAPVLLCLHQWGAHEHPSLMSREQATPGNGLLLFFRVDDFDASLKRARALVPGLEEEPHANPNTRTMEFSLRDPDGYYVTISALTSLERRGHEASA